MKGNKMGLRNYIIVTQCHLKKRHPAASQRWTRGGIASPRSLFEPTNHISIFSVDGFLGLEGQGYDKIVVIKASKNDILPEDEIYKENGIFP